MSTLEARIAKLETRQGTTAERTAFQLDDATLERIIVAFLVSATPEEIEAELSAHPEFRELYVELMPKALELYQARNENQVRRREIAPTRARVNLPCVQICTHQKSGSHARAGEPKLRIQS